MSRRLFFLLLSGWIMLLLSGCSDHAEATNLPVVPDYSQTEYWFEGGDTDEMAYDVFYIVPTCVFDWQDAEGNICHWMDPDNPSHRASVDGPIRLARGIFADEANFYAPYYRQITIESWTESEQEIDSRFETAYSDIASAFHYYLLHFNEGRPLILAGHSQGGKAVIELLCREMDDETYNRMIAAYPLGYPVRDEKHSPYLIPAAKADDTGVFITFSSVSSPDKLTPLLSGSRAAINPLNWRTDSEPGTKEQHLGAVFTAATGDIVSEEAHMISASLDDATKALVLSGIDPQAYYEPALADLFPPGNYHVVELNLFYRNLQQNVKERAAAFFAAHADQ